MCLWSGLFLVLLLNSSGSPIEILWFSYRNHLVLYLNSCGSRIDLLPLFYWIFLVLLLNSSGSPIEILWSRFSQFLYCTKCVTVGIPIHIFVYVIFMCITCYVYLTFTSCFLCHWYSVLYFLLLYFARFHSSLLFSLFWLFMVLGCCSVALHSARTPPQQLRTSLIDDSPHFWIFSQFYFSFSVFS